MLCPAAEILQAAPKQGQAAPGKKGKTPAKKPGVPAKGPGAAAPVQPPAPVEPPPAAASSTPSGPNPAVAPEPTPAPVATDPASDAELEAIRKALEAPASSPAPAPAPAAVASMNPDMALILDTALAAFSVDEPLQGGGHDPTRSGFNFQQLELSIRSNVDPYFRFDANLVFSPFGVEVEEAYASTLSLPLGLKARAGQFLTRLGRLNGTHPHAWSFVDQPIVLSKFVGGEGNRGLGAELAWLTPLPWYSELFFSANNADGECCARSYYGADDLGVHSPADLMLTGAFKQFFTLGDDLGILWGLSTQLGPNPSGQGNHSALVGTDLYLKYQPGKSIRRSSLALTLELLQRSRQLPGVLLIDYGGYLQLVWQATPHLETGIRAERVTGLEADPLDPDWTTARSRYSAQVTWKPSHFSRLRLQGSVDWPEWLESPVYAGILALEVTAGAHGAHEF